MNKLKLIPRGLEGLKKLDKKLLDNIDKINKETPLRLRIDDISRRPKPLGGENTRIRGVKSIQDGLKLSKK